MCGEAHVFTIFCYQTSKIITYMCKEKKEPRFMTNIFFILIWTNYSSQLQSLYVNCALF